MSLNWQKQRSMVLLQDEKNLSQKRLVKKAGAIENNRRRLEEAHKNLKAASTTSRPAFYQTEIRKAQAALRKNIEREKQVLEKKIFFQNDMRKQLCKMFINFCESFPNFRFCEIYEI